MAKPKNSSTTTVTRVKAKDDKEVTKKQPRSSMPKKTATEKTPRRIKLGFLGSFFGYFKGSWHELKQVHWPNRRATWGMTTALLIFTGLFMILILLTDVMWENLFKLILE